MPLSKKTLLKTEKVTTSEEVEKGTKILYDKKQALVTTKLSEGKLLTTEKVTTSDGIDKGTNNLDDI